MMSLPLRALKASRFGNHGRMFIYYDLNGLLLFDENQTSPLRITNYLEIPAGLRHLAGDVAFL